MKNRTIASHSALTVAALALACFSSMVDTVIAAPVTVEQRGDDSDGDGIDSANDNCIELFNPEQIDSNGDGIGNRCDADLNGDCIVNVVDLGIFRTRFFSTDADADLNTNGVVNVVDLGILRTLFFRVPGPSGIFNACNLSVAASGDLDLNRSLGFDLDVGLQQGSLAPPVDVWYQALSATSSNFTPRNGTQLSVFGFATPSAQDCNASALSESPVSLATLSIDTWLCVRTNEGRISRFQIIAANGDPLNVASSVQISFTTWE